MSWQHVHVIRQLELPALQKLVLFALASRAGDSGECWPSIHTLRMDTGLAHRTVQYQLNTLVRRGLVIRDERRGCSALLRLQLCAPRESASPAGVHDGSHGVHAMTPPLHEEQETDAPSASEVEKELPFNRQEVTRTKPLSTTPATDDQTPVSSNPQRANTEPWWSTHAGIDRKGRTLGIPPRPGELYSDYKRRLIEAEHAQRLEAKAAGP